MLEVEESVENPSGSTTNARYFRRKWEPTRERKVEDHPLNAGVRRCAEEKVEYAWMVKCSYCGEMGDLTAYPTVDGTARSVLYGIANRSILLCHPCSEKEEL